MRQLRLLPVLLLMLVMTLPVLAQTVTITISPESGPVGTAFNITVRGLSPNSEYTLVFIHVDTDSTVFTTTRTANASGQLALNIASEASDPPGEYRVEVRSGRRVLADAVFTLEGGNAPGQPNPRGGEIELRVTPHTGAIGSTYDITASGLAAGQFVTIIIEFDETGEEVYRRTLNADDNGTVNLQIFTQEGDPAGDYTVTLLDEDDTALADDAFTVEAPTGRNGVVEIDQAGSTFTITIRDVRPFADLTVAILSPDSRRPIFEHRVRASVDGEAVVKFTPEADTVAGDYIVSVKERGEIEVASGSLTIGSDAIVAPEGVNVLVTPVSAAPGTLRIITATGLLAGETVLVEIRSGERVVFTEEKTADVNGTVALSVKNLGGDAPGEYTVSIKRSTEVVAVSQLTIESGAIVEQPAQQTDVVVDIDPTGGPIGTVYSIRVTGLEPNETIIIAIVLNGRTVFSSERTSDNSGVATLTINSEEGDTPGTYSVAVVRDGETLASTDFEVGSEAVETSGPATISIEPASGERGTSHMITITDLTPGETVTIEVLFAGNVVYSTERTADRNGSVTLTLAAGEEDEAGDYEVVVKRENTIIGEDTLTVLDTAAEPGTAHEIVMTIDPAEGARGSDHTITVTGLQPDETVTINVLFDGEVAFTTERTADRNGEVTLVLTSGDSDPAGDYTITVVRDDDIVAEGTLTVLDTAVEPPVTASDISIAIAPESGPVGTSHTVTVRNLEPGETVTLEVLFDGEVVYTTERTANRNGVVTINLKAEESDPAGVYTVQIIREGEVVAQADLTVEGGEAVVTTTPSSSSLLNVTDAFAGREMSYTFEGEEGQFVVIQLTSPDFDTYLSLRDSSGTELTYNDDFGGTLNSFIGPFALPYTGEYTVVVTSYDTLNGASGISGDFTLDVQTAAFTALEYGRPASVEFAPDSGAQYFSFVASEGDIIQILVDSQSSIDTTLALNDPNGVNVAADDDSGSGFDPEIVRYLVTTSGQYTVVLTGYTPGESGQVEIVINHEEARHLEDGPQQVQLNPKQTADVVIYEGAAGEQALLAIEVVSGSASGVTINVTQNGVLLMTYSSVDIPPGTMLGFSIPDSGTISITVQSDGTATATLEFEIRPVQQ